MGTVVFLFLLFPSLPRWSRGRKTVPPRSLQRNQGKFPKSCGDNAEIAARFSALSNICFREEKKREKREQEGWEVDPEITIEVPFDDSGGLPRNVSRSTSPVECFLKMMSKNIVEHCTMELNQRLEEEHWGTKPV